MTYLAAYTRSAHTHTQSSIGKSKAEYESSLFATKAATHVTGMGAAEMPHRYDESDAPSLRQTRLRRYAEVKR